MIVFLNGAFVPEEQAVISVFDRSFRYGDGIFETALAVNGRLFRWQQHWDRLSAAAKSIGLALPCSSDDLQNAAIELLRRNQLSTGVVRVQISRGAGPRGYAPSGEETPVVVITANELQSLGADGWRLALSPIRVPRSDTLGGQKTANRLAHVLAAQHAKDAGAHESLLLDTEGVLLEGGSSNLFWVRDGTVYTTPLFPAVRSGVTRETVIELCRILQLPCEEAVIRPEELFDCNGAFLTLSTRGVVEAISLDGKPLRRSALARELQSAFDTLVAMECGLA
jgi:aminodeoxychorismate lyase